MSRVNIAHIRADNTVDLNWIGFANGPVNTLELSANILFVGGEFSVLSGQPRSNIGAVVADSGVLIDFWSADADKAVLTMGLSGSILYLGGEFTTIAGRERRNIAAVSTIDGQLTPWNPRGNGVVRALEIEGDSIYAGGQFTHIGNRNRNRLARLSSASNTADDWNPNVSDTVFSITVSGSHVYFGGDFFNVGGQSRQFIASVEISGTGSVTSWNPLCDSRVSALVVSGQTITLGGRFRSLGGEARNRLGALNVGTGELLAWNPNANRDVLSLAVSDETVLAGGQFISVGGVERENMASLNVDNGTATDWNPGADNRVNALVVKGNTVYVGGAFTKLGGLDRSFIGTINANNGEIGDWNPNADKEVKALAVTGNTVYAGGFFTQIFGQTRDRIASLHTVKNQANAWNPGANHPVLAIATTGNEVYAGGEFTEIGGEPLKFLAKLSANTGQVELWNPQPDGIINSIIVKGDTVYAGGQFSQFGVGTTRSRIAAIDSIGDVLGNWNPEASRESSNISAVFTLAALGGTVYVGGDFELLGGSARNSLGSVNISDGAADFWNPNLSGQVFALAVSGNNIYAGGSFETAGGLFQPNLAAFSLQGAPVLTSEPASQSIALGTLVRLEVGAKGTEPLVYQWQKEGFDLPGKTQSVLIIDPAQTGDAGEYSVVVKNEIGVATSRPFVLSVLASPLITQQPSSQTVATGSDATFTVTATGSEPLSYQWLKNGVILAEQNESTLVLTGLKAIDSGSFQVSVANAVGGVLSEAANLEVVVQGALVLVDNFADSQDVVGQSTGTVAGDNSSATQESSEPKHAGKRGGKSLWLSWVAPGSGVATFNTLGSTFDTLLAVYTGTSIGSLTHVVSDQDGGGFFASEVSFNAVSGQNYKIAIDGFSGASGNVVLNWNLDVTENEEVPKIFRLPQSQSVSKGDKVTLTVEAETPNNRLLTYEWFVNGVRNTQAKSDTLVISDFQEKDVGQYTVNVRSGNHSIKGLSAVVEIGPIAEAYTHDKLEDLVPGDGSSIALRSLRRRGKLSAPSVSIGVVGPGQLFNPFGSARQPGEGGPARSYAIDVRADGWLVVDTIGTEKENPNNPDIRTFLKVYDQQLTSLGENNGGASDGLRSLLKVSVQPGVHYLQAFGLNSNDRPITKGIIKLNWKLGTVPQITTHPSPQVASIGDTVTFSVSASGNPEPKYQWRKDGVDLPNQTGSSITLQGVKKTDEGVYSVVVENFVDSFSSQNAQLTVASLQGVAQISGAVRYYTGDAIPGATVLLRGGQTGSEITSGSGSFGLSADRGGDYSVGILQPSDNPRHGVTTGDISLMRLHILGRRLLNSPYKVLAADVNHSASLTTLDIALMRRLILAITDVFSGGKDIWKFVPSDFVFGNPSVPWPYESVRSYSGLDAGQASQDFVAIKSGDVNGSWTPSVSAAVAAVEIGGGRPEAGGVSKGLFSVPAAQSKLQNPESGIPVRNVSPRGVSSTGVVSLSAGNENILPNRTGRVPIAVTGFKNVTTAQFSVKWEPAMLTFVSVEDVGLEGLSKGNFNAELAGDGVLSVSWDDPNAVGVSLVDGTAIFALEFTVVGTEGESVEIEIGDEPTVREVTVDFEPVDFLTRNGSVQFGEIISLEPPRITSEPENQTVIVGEKASFAVSASGDAPLTYQWQFNGVDLVSATGETMEIPEVSAEHEGDYAVVVSNDGGTMTSSEAQLEVVVRPALSIDAEGQINLTGSVGQRYRIEYTEELRDENQWTELTTISLTDSSIIVDGVNSDLLTNRFYRAVWIP